jgi:hypothetical protein
MYRKLYVITHPPRTSYLTFIQLGDLAAEATLLKSQCDALKTQRQNLKSELASSTSDLEKVRAELEKLTREQDGLRLKFKSEQDINEWYLRRELTHSASSAFAAGTSQLPVSAVRAEGYAVGAANRSGAIWEDRCKEKETALEEERTRHGEEMEKERAIAARLRDRIAILEKKWREKQSELDEALEEVKRQKAEVDLVRSRADEEGRRSSREWDDIKLVHENSRKSLEALRTEMEVVLAAKQKAEEEIVSLKEHLAAARRCVSMHKPKQFLKLIPLEPIPSSSSPIAQSLSAFHAHQTRIEPLLPPTHLTVTPHQLPKKGRLVSHDLVNEEVRSLRKAQQRSLCGAREGAAEASERSAALEGIQARRGGEDGKEAAAQGGEEGQSGGRGWGG